MNRCTFIFLILLLLVTDAEVQELYQLLGGRPVLLPVPEKQKHPWFSGWQELTWEDTQDPGTMLEFRKRVIDPEDPERKHMIWEVFDRCSYREELARRPGCCVLLGQVSGGLCSIDFDDGDFARQFISLNPWTRQSLRTQGSSRGCNIWLILEGEYPESANIARAWTREEVKAYRREQGLGPEDDFDMPSKQKALGEWRADGRHTMIAGTHPSGQPYRKIRDFPPAIVRWDDIRWPVGPVYPWVKDRYAELAERYGDALYQSENGTITINQPFFAALYAAEHHVLREPEEDRFYVYEEETGAWREETIHAIKHQQALDLLRVARELNKPVLIRKRTDTLLNNLASLLKGEVQRWKAFEHSKEEAGILHLKNGMLDIRTKPIQLHAFSPQFYSRNPVPVALDPKATCPRFLKELIYSAMDAEQAELLQKLAGQALLGINITQRFLILEGTSGGGKSTWVNVLVRMIGLHNQTELRTEHLSKQFEIYNYIGKTLLIGVDVPGNFLNNSGAAKIKGLTGGDYLAGEQKNGRQYTVKGDFNVIITCNSRLHLKTDGDAEAWRRRLIRIVYNRPAPERKIPNFEQILVDEEGPGILNWMIQGAMKLLADVRETGSIILTPGQKQIRDDLLAESDSIREFIRNCIEEAEEGERADLTVDEILKHYFEYCEFRNWLAKSRSEVERALPDLMAEYFRVNKVNDIKRMNEEGTAETSRRGFRHVRLAKRVEGHGTRGEGHVTRGEGAGDADEEVAF